MAYRYLLGDSRGEAARLRRQAALWDPVAHALFDRIGVRRGFRVLEVGPGQGSLHLALRKRVRGPIDAVERSPAFAERLATLCARDRLGAGTTWVCDLDDADLPRGRYDLIFARWVFLFLPRPERAIAKLARALKPGGRLAIEDYHRETLAMIPRPAEWPRFLDADRAFFASQGGDVSIGGRLPELFRDAGLALEEVTPTVKVARPGSPAWRWMTDYFLGVLDRYVEHGPLTAAEAARLRRRWRAAERAPTSLLIAPAVLDVVGKKRR